MNIAKIQAELAELADPQTASGSQRFFKTGPGEYGAGDLFRGIRVPNRAAELNPASIGQLFAQKWLLAVPDPLLHLPAVPPDTTTRLNFVYPMVVPWSFLGINR